jgi:signal peptidase I
MISLKEKDNYEKQSFLAYLRAFWQWLWNSESIWSYVVFLALLFIIVKFIFLPVLGFLLGVGFSMNSLPLAIVESSSMEHYSLQLTSNGVYDLCGSSFSNQKFFNKNDYWNTCGKWYSQNTNLTKEEFQNFPLSNGFRKGDIMVIWGWSKPKIGDVIVYNSGRQYPIIHRMVSQNADGSFQTKGDHNSGQIKDFMTDETHVNESQVIGKAVFRIPYAGWIKLFFVELFKKI